MNIWTVDLDHIPEKYRNNPRLSFWVEPEWIFLHWRNRAKPRLYPAWPWNIMVNISHRAQETSGEGVVIHETSYHDNLVGKVHRLHSHRDDMRIGDQVVL
ncbi:MAG: hypothetical protein ACRCWR_02280, partial [Saezia sp.]